MEEPDAMGEGGRKAPVAAVLLAAGGASRFGSAKQLALFEGNTLARRAAETACASRCRTVLAVTGCEAAAVAAQFEGLPVRTVVNRRWRDGLASSIRRGIQSVPPEDEGALLLLCDQPLVTPAHLDALLREFEASFPPAVASLCGGRTGPPALFSRALFPELAELSGDRGAKGVLDRHGSRVIAVSFPPASVDVDRPSDLDIPKNFTA